MVDGVARELGFPLSGDVARLGPKLAELSAAYNQGKAEGARTAVPLEARLAFSFVRDVPKGAGAVRELVASGLLGGADDARPLRILDLGAGLGAMTWGIVRALRAAGHARPVEALLVDEDPRALGAAEAIARAAVRAGQGDPALTIKTRVFRVGGDLAALPAVDLVIAGQVLSELDLAAAPADRVEKHVTLVQKLLAKVAPDGAVVVVEPALRERSRHLEAVRDRLVAAGRTVFAPCLHAKTCPALALEGEWCHEDLAVDLPEWTVPLARAAGLRYQGLTFSYLVLRPDGATMRASFPPGDTSVRLRVISDLMRTKGKAEIFACADDGERRRLRRLDRHEDATPTGWGDLHRGDCVAIRPPGPRGPEEPVAAGAPVDGAAAAEPAVDERGRLSERVAIDVWPFSH